jgi:hypothetical protein
MTALDRAPLSRLLRTETAGVYVPTTVGVLLPWMLNISFGGIVRDGNAAYFDKRSRRRLEGDDAVLNAIASFGASSKRGIEASVSLGRRNAGARVDIL